MAKTPSQKLYQIIHSLTPAEKRYFKLRYAKSQGDDSKYLILFEVIEKMIVLNEPALQKAVYGVKKIEGKKFSELKNYCYQLILSTLRDYDNEHSVDYRIKNNSLYIRSLYKRALYEDCQFLIDKTLRIAEEYEQFETMLELLRWRKQIAYARGDIDFLNSNLNPIAEQENLLLAQVANILFYKNAFYQVHTTIRKYRLLENEELQNILKKLSKSEMFSGLEKALSFTAKIIYLRTASLMSYAMRDNENFYNYGKVLIDLMLSKPLLLKEDVSEYISANSNFVMACMLTERSEATLDALENFNRVAPKTYDDRLKVHRQYFQGIFDFYHNTGEFDKGYQMLKKHLIEKQQFDNQSFNSQGFYYAYFYTSFGSKHYNEALDYLNEWLSDRNTVDRQDLQALARILSLIIHFEMGNTILLDSLMRSTSRYLNKNTKMTVFEKEILRFIRKASTSANRAELKIIATDVLNSLSELSEDVTQSNFMQYFDFIAWIESKITNVDFAKIVQQRFAAKKIK